MSVSNMPPIDRAEQSTAHEIQQAKVIDLNDRVLNLDNPDDKMISAFANYAVQTENWQQNALQALRSWICPYISRHLLSLNPLQARCRRYSRGER